MGVGKVSEMVQVLTRNAFCDGRVVDLANIQVVEDEVGIAIVDVVRWDYPLEQIREGVIKRLGRDRQVLELL